MRFDVVTIFPELFAPHLEHGITRRAFGSLRVDLRLWPLRDFADDAYRRVDDRPYGGGPGMVMLAQPLLRAVDAIRADRAAAADTVPVPVVHFTPTGKPLTQAHVAEFARGNGAILVCGRYEGVDQRFIDARVTHEISLGDYVLSGGELPALVLLDAVARLQEGVLTATSHEMESFSDGLLEAPCYSRPEVLTCGRGDMPAHVVVPATLLSGHHRSIARWRRERSLELTARRRPDLLARARAEGRLDHDDEQYLRSLGL
jgi:tRNA (guanine37-N1)-methyltransferase